MPRLAKGLAVDFVFFDQPAKGAAAILSGFASRLRDGAFVLVEETVFLLCGIWNSPRSASSELLDRPARMKQKAMASRSDSSTRGAGL